MNLSSDSGDHLGSAMADSVDGQLRQTLRAARSRCLRGVKVVGKGLFDQQKGVFFSCFNPKIWQNRC